MIELNNIPHSSGCYMYYDNLDKIIYIGKAKDLKKRVSQYFNRNDLDIKTKTLVSQINKLDFIVTDNEVEALILENNLIKKHTPKYNISLRDSKRYAFIVLTNEEFPRLLISRSKDEFKDGTFIGPFVSAQKRDYIREFIIKTFKIRTCKKFPKKTCLRYHIQLCEAPCVQKITKEEYNSKFPIIKQVLKGDIKKIIIKLKNQMNELAKDLKFEEALILRNQIDSLIGLEEKQKVELERNYDEDIINFEIKKEIVYLMLFNIHNGMLENKQEFIIDYKEDFFEEFLLIYYSENKIPKEIIIKEKISKSFKLYLEKIKNSKVDITIPKIGTKKHLLDLVSKNIELSFFESENKLLDLKEKLNLSSIPKIIECFDISHLSGTMTVASMVQFENGIPNNSEYRRFKIKSVQGIDDFKSIAEVVYRRYTRILNENKKLPDLIVIDGGKGQLSSAVSQLIRLNLKIPIISIAKREEEIFTPNETEPLIFPKNSKGLFLLQNIRDEAHRFAINYNKLLRTKKLKKTENITNK